MTPPDPILAQLLIMRAQLDLVIAQLEAPPSFDPVLLPTARACVHPEEKRADASTLGGPSKWICLECEQEFAGVLP